jgi:transcriptional regulator with XRE-family HTH domain
MTEVIKTIADRFSEERTKLGLTQVELAAIAGVSKVTISHYASGKSLPSTDVLIKLDELGADVHYILSGKKSSPSIDIHRLSLAIEAAHKQDGLSATQDYKSLAEKAISIFQAWDFVLEANASANR